MSYKSLLFCPDDASARLVTQVLSELEFTVELAGETYAAVKRLNDEHFDALVVDCQNEQDAALLFKTAKNSSQNHASLTVAVVEGQAGVAKAFRIGANLVLTKPINVEQSKGTLRVARGLLKKNQPKPAGETPTTAGASLPAFAVNAAPVAPASVSAFSATASAAGLGAAAIVPAPEKPVHADVPYAGLELEKDPLPSAEAADAAVLDSLPQLPKAPVSASVLSSHAAPIAPTFTGLSMSGAAAAAAPALEKRSIELHAGASAPQFTNEPIVKDAGTAEIFETPVAAPSFSSLESHSGSEGGSNAFLKIAVVLLVVAVGGFFGWRKLQPMHRNSEPTLENAAQESQQSESQTHLAPVQAQTSSPATVIPAPSVIDQTPKNSEEEISANAAAPRTHSADADNIEIQEMPFSRDSKVTVTPKPQPLVVKAGAPKPVTQVSTPVAPSLDLAGNASTATIANLMPTDSPLPKPAPGTVRISQGISQGLLFKKVAPSYPPMALQLHRAGVVELLATVNKEGRIANIKVLSGDSMLVKPAVDAVRQWQYRPYLLNGQPLEVETQISVSFKLPK
jgi:TonB family protein